MSFREQKIIRLLGRIVGNINIIGVVYADGTWKGSNRA